MPRRDRLPPNASHMASSSPSPSSSSRPSSILSSSSSNSRGGSSSRSASALERWVWVGVGVVQQRRQIHVLGRAAEFHQPQARAHLRRRPRRPPAAAAAAASAAETGPAAGGGAARPTSPATPEPPPKESYHEKAPATRSDHINIPSPVIPARATRRGRPPAGRQTPSEPGPGPAPAAGPSPGARAAAQGGWRGRWRGWPPHGGVCAWGGFGVCRWMHASGGVVSVGGCCVAESQPERQRRRTHRKDGWRSPWGVRLAGRGA